MKEIKYKPIGVVHSPFKEPHGVPVQPARGKDIDAVIEVFPEYVEGLKDIEGFSHIILICHLHLSKAFSLKVKPFLDNELRGVFATRAPSRPNPIGISVVRLIRVEEGKLYIKDIDMIDGTPILDIKPYVSEFDPQKKIKIGWLEKRVHKLPETRDDERFIK